MSSTVYNANNLDVLRNMPDNSIDLCIDDPPYGIRAGGHQWHKESTGSRMILQPTGKMLEVPDSVGGEEEEWDMAPPPEYWRELFRVCKHHIIWGCNYLDVPEFRSSSGRIFWHKFTSGYLSRGELAWVSNSNVIDYVPFTWNGHMQAKSVKTGHVQRGDKKNNVKRIQTCQKPVPVYRYILERYAKPGDVILDPHMGSGSSRLAAAELGLSYIGCEISQKRFQNQENRWAKERPQPNLLSA